MTDNATRTIPLLTRQLGRTGREVTTFGLGGQAAIQWTPDGVAPADIIVKAVKLGVTYLDTSNVYGPSQRHFGEAFGRLGLRPDAPNYDAGARDKIFLASKTHFRSARRPEGERFRTDFSEGMGDAFGVKSAQDDVRRSLSLMFGDGQGGYPESAYLDAVQIHNLNTLDEVDMIYRGLDDAGPDTPWVGALAALLDLREGTNRTGTNPKREKLVRHIGITGHWNTLAHMVAIQRDTRRILDTLLVAINASDREYLCHQHNAIPVAAAAGMGIIGMKVFADGAYFHKDARFSMSADDLWREVGAADLDASAMIQYPLSIPGVTTVIVGIGHIDDDPGRCQLVTNIEASQLPQPLGVDQLRAAEALVCSERRRQANSYFQRASVGLTPPRNAGVDADVSSKMFGRRVARVSWDTAIAGSEAIERYDVVSDGAVVGSVPHRPQFSPERFVFEHALDYAAGAAPRRYVVRAVDAGGATAETAVLTAVV